MRCVCVCIILLYPRAPTTSLDTLDLRLLPWTQICLTICALLTWIMTASGRGCCVPWCDKTRKDATVLHSFPNPDKDMARYNEWTRAIGTSVSSLDPQYVFRNRRVCHAHFETKYLTWSRRLSPDAVPTLFTPDCDRFELSPTTKDEESSLAASPLPPSSLQLPSSRPTHVPFVINILEPLLQIVNNLKLLLVTAQAHDVQ
ncbi:uncharacterized protein LOC111359841 isoform X4 [Spodoptera litura]|uniref:Uncharacterized protein LOC111359841 isoform X4 n=1 Tax=Spodoptera litura TaxID=69820 RepID=A0A9J7EI53_SPOLT|nr:uncharacterized protein LOC111359841 isoform X4 [Spodoptera litura]